MHKPVATAIPVLFDRYRGQPQMSNVPVAVVAGALEADPASAGV